MDGSIPAEEFPSLYRAILDGVAALERIGQRDEAQRIRSAATAAYSGPWAAPGHHRLELLLVRIDRALAAPERLRSPRRRAGAAVLERGGLGALIRRVRVAR